MKVKKYVVDIHCSGELARRAGVGGGQYPMTLQLENLILLGPQLVSK